MEYGEDRRCFAVGVFQDSSWAERGLDALKKQGFAPESLSLLAKHTAETEALVEKTFGVTSKQVEVSGLGATVAHGELLGTLQGNDGGLGRNGVAATIGRAGFQSHDGFIYETLTARGGILVAIDSEARVSDAIAILHSYGGGNAAIGAWAGRV